MVGRIIATSLQLGGRLGSAEVLVAVASGYDQKSTSFGTTRAAARCASRTADTAAVLTNQRLATLERVPINLRSGLDLRRTRYLHAGEEAHVTRVSVYYP